MDVVESYPFRVIRNADFVIQELEAADLLETMEESVRKRRFGSVVHLAINPGMPENLQAILIENLDMDENDVYEMDNPLGMSNLMQLYEIDRYDLKDPPFIPSLPLPLKAESFDGNIFSAIRQARSA